MKVYIVTSGAYSDYGICRVFLDKRKAETYCRYANLSGRSWDDDHRIEEYDTSDETYDAPETGFWTFEAEADVFKEQSPSSELCIYECARLTERDESSTRFEWNPFAGCYGGSIVRSFPETSYGEADARAAFEKIAHDEFARLKKLASDGERLDLLYPWEEGK